MTNYQNPISAAQFSFGLWQSASKARTITKYYLGRIAYIAAMTAVPIVGIYLVDAVYASRSAISRHASRAFTFAELWDAQSHNRSAPVLMGTSRPADASVRRP